MRTLSYVVIVAVSGCGSPADSTGFDGGAPDGAAVDAPRGDAAAIDAAIPAGMAYVAGGEFMMGCNEALDSVCSADELPYHAVHVSGFAIDILETTQSEYAGCVTAGACAPPAKGRSCSSQYDPSSLGTFPVSCLVWSEAADYCAWAGKRLPTEAEWEKAARGADGRVWPWGNTLPDCSVANYGLNIDCDELAPVGSYPDGASPYGVLDMASNVREYVADYYDPSYYGESPTVDPTGPPSGALHVVRGGMYQGDTASLGTSRRESVGSEAGYFVGLRCAKSGG